MTHGAAQRVDTVLDDGWFYKYVSRATGRIVLETRSLRWSSPLAFNDPYDNQFDFDVDVDHDDARQLALSKLWTTYSCGKVAQIDRNVGDVLQLMRAQPEQFSRARFEQIFASDVEANLADFKNKHLPEILRQIRLLARQHKILCLSQTGASVLMWAYYAERQQGLVLRFRSVPNLDSPWQAGHQVQYSERMPLLADAEALSDLLLGAPNVRDIALSALKRLVFTKSREWVHEREWRIFCGSGRTPDAQFEDIHFDALELDGVIVGCRMAADDRQAISDLVRRNYPHAQLLQAVKRQREYGLNIQAI
jgi:hypothetical protein